MTTNWRALCAELYGIFEKYDDESNLAGIYWDMEMDKNDVLDRARAALAEADGPAVPEGREPASVAGEPSDEELRDIWETGHLPSSEELANDDGEQDLHFLFTSAYYRWLEENPDAMEEHNNKCIRAVFNAGRRWGHQSAPPAEGEQRHPAPVPVSERLPGPKDCDAEGRCWFSIDGAQWALEDRIYGCDRYRSHWLPADALPLPAGEVER